MSLSVSIGRPSFCVLFSCDSSSKGRNVGLSVGRSVGRSPTSFIEVLCCQQCIYVVSSVQYSSIVVYSVYYSSVQQCIVQQYSSSIVVQCIVQQYSSVQQCIVQQYSDVQYSSLVVYSVLYSSVQYSSVQCIVQQYSSSIVVYSSCQQCIYVVTIIVAQILDNSLIMFCIFGCDSSSTSNNISP